MFDGSGAGRSSPYVSLDSAFCSPQEEEAFNLDLTPFVPQGILIILYGAPSLLCLDNISK